MWTWQGSSLSGGGGQMSKIVHKPYLVKLSTKGGGGVKNVQKSVHMIYEWPLSIFLFFQALCKGSLTWVTLMESESFENATLLPIFVKARYFKNHFYVKLYLIVNSVYFLGCISFSFGNQKYSNGTGSKTMHKKPNWHIFCEILEITYWKKF